MYFYNLIKKHIDLYFILLIFFVYLCYLFSTKYSALPYDSGQYFETSALFIKNKSFSFINFNDSLRGYLYPLLNLPGKTVSYFFNIEPITITRIIGAMTASLLFGHAIPHLWQLINKKDFPTLKQRVLLVAISFIFWRDYFNFPLTDFPAVLCVCYSIILLAKNLSTKNCLLAGIFITSAINMRPVYIIVFPFIVFFVIYQNLGGSFFKKVFPLFLGAIIISFPQFLINLYQYNSFSPLVHPVMVDQSKSLYLSQLEWGIVIQKYETSIDKAYPIGALVFSDPVGVEIMSKERIKVPSNFGASNEKLLLSKQKLELNEITSYFDYIKCFAKYPIDFAVIYFKHIFNGFDIQYYSPYITDVSEYNFILIILNYSILFLFLLILISLDIKKFKISYILILCIFLSPCLVAIPTAIECRFFLPIHLLLYSTIIFAWPKKWTWHYISSQANLSGLFIYIVFIMICLTMSSQTQINLAINSKTLSIND